MQLMIIIIFANYIGEKKKLGITYSYPQTKMKEKKNYCRRSENEIIDPAAAARVLLRHAAKLEMP